MAERVIAHFGGSLAGRTIAVWGLTFKPRTDDIREAPALTIIDLLLAAGAAVQVYDPVGMDRVRELYGDRLSYAPRNLEALDGADALVVATEWLEFRTLDFDELRARMKRLVIFDGRNLYAREDMMREGAAHLSIGRADVGAEE